MQAMKRRPRATSARFAIAAVVLVLAGELNPANTSDPTTPGITATPYIDYNQDNDPGGTVTNQRLDSTTASASFTVSSSNGATIWYTTDGSVPVEGSSSSFATSGQVSITESRTISAIATMNQMDPSSETSATYTPQPRQASLSPAAGSYTELQQRVHGRTIPVH